MTSSGFCVSKNKIFSHSKISSELRTMNGTHFTFMIKMSSNDRDIACKLEHGTAISLLN